MSEVMIYFFPTTIGLAPGSWKDDGTYPEDKWPKDAVELTQDEKSLFWLQGHPEGKALGVSKSNRPVWVDIPPQSNESIIASNIERLRDSNQIAEYQKISLSNRIGTINDAIEFDDATQDEIYELEIRKKQLVEWKRYAILLGRIIGKDGMTLLVDWPVEPDSGIGMPIHDFN